MVWKWTARMGTVLKAKGGRNSFSSRSNHYWKPSPSNILRQDLAYRVVPYSSNLKNLKILDLKKSEKNSKFHQSPFLTWLDLLMPLNRFIVCKNTISTYKHHCNELIWVTFSQKWAKLKCTRLYCNPHGVILSFILNKNIKIVKWRSISNSGHYKWSMSCDLYQMTDWQFDKMFKIFNSKSNKSFTLEWKK